MLLPVLFVVTLPFTLFFLGLLLRAGGGKYDGVDPDVYRQHTGRVNTAVIDRPNTRASQPERVEQTLPHTCGLRSMEAAYIAYGLDPDAFNIRFRLGTDFAAVPTDSESTGTLHPDMLRVLAQDGFVTTVLDLEDAGAAQRLSDHLDDGQLALTVVYRSTYHWMLLAGDGPGRLWVVDSLSSEGRSCDTVSFLDTEALSVILIRRRSSTAAEPSRTAQHLLGTREMARTYDRHQARAE